MSKRQSKPRRHIFLRLEKLMVPETGEVIKAFIAANGVSRRLLKDRKFRIGEEVRAELKRSRNPAFFRKGHSLGQFIADNVAEFEGKNQHEVMKEIQRITGVCCDKQEIDLGPLGKVAVNVARSMSFDDMDESEFQSVYDALFRYAHDKYFHTLDAEKLQELIDFAADAA